MIDAKIYDKIVIGEYMKHVMIFPIKIYQSIPTSIHNSCRFTPTCSEYSKQSYERFGFFKGTYLTIKRLLRCVPWNKDNPYDPVPIKEEK